MQHESSDTQVDQITRTDETQRKRLMKYASKLPDSSRRKAMASAVDFSYRVKTEHPGVGKTTLIYCGFIVALKDYHYSEHTAPHRKGSARYVGLAEEVFEERIMAIPKNRKNSQIKNKVKAHLGKIHTARKKGVSFSDISTFLNVKYKIKVSAEYIRRIYNENCI